MYGYGYGYGGYGGFGGEWLLFMDMDFSYNIYFVLLIW